METDSEQHWESEWDFFVPLRMSNCIIFYITLLNWEFLLKWYNFFWNFCWNRGLLLCTTISIDFNSQISFPYVKESESEILESGSRSRIFYLRLRNPGRYVQKETDGNSVSMAYAFLDLRDSNKREVNYLLQITWIMLML